MPLDERLRDEDRLYKPMVDEETNIKGTVIPRAKHDGGSTGFDPNKPLPCVVWIDDKPTSMVIEEIPAAKKASVKPKKKRTVRKVEIAQEELSPPPPAKKAETGQFIDQMIGGRKKPMPKKPEEKIEEQATPSKKEKVVVMDQPDVKVKFEGNFGELETFYFEANIQNEMVILVWRTDYRGSKYTPPITKRTGDNDPEPILITVGDKVYPVYNFNLKFTISSAKLEILVLPIVKADEGSADDEY